MPADIVAKVKAKEADILAGKFTVKVDDEPAEVDRQVGAARRRTMAGPAPVLRLSGITKRFGALVANDAISLELGAGEVLALLGENGAGKSTLVSILFGHYVADAGAIEVFGQPLPPGQPKAALAAGIGMVHQHFTLADNLSVLDNVMLGTEPLWQPFSRRARGARAAARGGRSASACRCEPDALVGDLSVGERQRVEILKALYRGARILILDEPTAVLTPQESEALFATLGADGGAGPVDHLHQPQARRGAARVAPRRGAARRQAGGRGAAAGTTQAQLAQWMVGQAVAAPARRPAARTGEAVCALENVSTRRRRARPARRRLAAAARRRDHRHRRRLGQRPGGAGRAAVRACAGPAPARCGWPARRCRPIAGAAGRSAAWRASRKTGTRSA